MKKSSLLRRVSLVEPKGQIVRDCPGTKNHICCGLKIIDMIEGCVLFCSYCVLRTYLNSREIKVVNDMRYIISQIDAEIEKEPNHFMRFCTGELSDSLALDRILRLNVPLIEFFGTRRKAILELKSKWAYIEHLLPYLNRYTVISFSVAPEKIIKNEEKRTSPLRKRLLALKKAIDRGLYVGLHFDPIVIYPGFEKDYGALIDDIARTIDLKRVIWVSLGALRFPRSLFRVLLEEKRRNLFFGEFILGEDGKMRYLKAQRINAYQHIYGCLREKDSDIFIYLCMERPFVWKSVTGEEITKDEDLIFRFDERVKSFYGGEI